MSKELNEFADLRRFVMSLSDELQLVSEEVARLMPRLDAYQIVIEGLCVAHHDRQTVSREVQSQIENLARILATVPVARERYLGQLVEHLVPLLVTVARPRNPQSG